MTRDSGKETCKHFEKLRRGGKFPLIGPSSVQSTSLYVNTYLWKINSTTTTPTTHAPTQHQRPTKQAADEKRTKNFSGRRPKFPWRLGPFSAFLSDSVWRGPWDLSSELPFVSLFSRRKFILEILLVSQILEFCRLPSQESNPNPRNITPN